MKLNFRVALFMLHDFSLKVPPLSMVSSSSKSWWKEEIVDLNLSIGMKVFYWKQYFWNSSWKSALQSRFDCVIEQNYNKKRRKKKSSSTKVQLY